MIIDFVDEFATVRIVCIIDPSVRQISTYCKCLALQIAMSEIFCVESRPPPTTLPQITSTHILQSSHLAHLTQLTALSPPYKGVMVFSLSFFVVGSLLLHHSFAVFAVQVPP